MKKKMIFFILFALISRMGVVTAQELESSLRIAELNKMVKLDETQKKKLNRLYEKYVILMDSAINKTEDIEKSALIIYHCKQAFNTKFMDLLSDKQRIEYVRTYATPEVAEKAKVKLKILSNLGEYSEKQLKKHYTEIFEYLMLEKIVYATERYNIEKQKENIAQLKALEPEGLKTANTLQKIKHQGVKYQDGFQW